MAQSSEGSTVTSRPDRRLIPQFILDCLARGELSGQFPATGVFFDLSGFTHLTESLMAYGPHGAEVLASVVESVFAPLVGTVFAHGGFVASFHGDAFTALFPAESGDKASAARLGLAAAWRMRQHLMTRAVQETPFGEFPLAAKIGLATGDAEWDIPVSEADERAVYSFRGTAVVHCADAENLAAQNDIILAPTVYQLVSDQVTAELHHDHFRLIDLAAPLPPSRQPDLALPLREVTRRFLPAAILDLALRGEFRQVIALFINLSGAPGTNELREFGQVCFALQRAYGGFFHRIVFDDKGCNLQVFWGAPTSQEKDIARALNFILALRRECKVTIRGGLTHRRAFAGFVGSPLYEEYTCYSRGVNLAARLMSGAEWGEIHLSSEVAEQAAGQFRTEFLGERTYKGIATPQAVSRLLGAETSAQPAFFRGRLVGRERELGALSAAVAPLFEGRFAGVTTIIGEVGSGKSRLAHTFLEELDRSHHCQILRAQTDEILRQPLNPFRYALRDYFNQSQQDDEEANRASFEAKLGDLIDATAGAELRAELDRTRSFLGSLVDLHWPNSLYEQVEPQFRVQNTFAALEAVLAAESLRRPLILLLEDAHMLDSSSREFLGRLIRNVTAYPIALLVTSRQELDPELFEPETPQHSIWLRPLVEGDLEAMIEELVGEPPSPALVKQIAAETGGNPLFAGQLLLYLRNNQLLDNYAQSRALPGKTDVYLPTDVRSLMVAQIDQLPASLKDVAQVASILGREFNASVLSAMLPNREALDSDLAHGVDRGVWYPLEKERFLFHHGLLRDAAYDMQLTTRRRDLHSQAAAALVRLTADDAPAVSRLAEIAHHYDQASMAEAAGSYYGRAGELAAVDYFNDQAIAYYTRALELTSPADIESSFRLRSGREAIFGLVGRREEQFADLEALDALIQGDSPAGREASVRLRRASYSLALGDYAEAIAHAEQAAVLARSGGDVLSELEAGQRIGRALWQQGRTVEAEPPLRQALDLSRQGKYRAQTAECLYDLGVIYQYRGNYREAYGYGLEAQEIFDSLVNRPGMVRCLNLIGMTLYSLGDYAESQEAYSTALTLTHEIGWRYAESTLLANLGNIHFELGSFDLAHRYFSQAVQLARQIGDRQSESVALDTLGLIEHYEGHLTRARQDYEAALVLAESIQNDRNCGYTLTHLGFTLLELGEPDAAARIFDRALGFRRHLGNEAAIMDTLSGLAAAAAARGQSIEARQYVAQIITWIGANGTEGLELPIQTYLICYEILRRVAQQFPEAAATAEQVLANGHALLLQRANQINDQSLRRQFLEQVPFNRRLRELWSAANERAYG